MSRLPTHLTWSAFPAVADCAFGILETHLRGTERLECAACERRRSPIPTVPTPSASYWTGLGAQRPAAMPSPGGDPHDRQNPYTQRAIEAAPAGLRTEKARRSRIAGVPGVETAGMEGR